MESVAERVAQVAQVVEPAIEAEGYDLVDIELKGGAGGRVLRLFIDKPPDGITVDDCRRVSRLLGPMLDAEDLVKGRYYLEVSSPGVNRRVRKREDFERFIGSKIRIHTRSPIEGRRKFTGVIEGVDNGDVVVKCETSGLDAVKRIPLAAIDKANLQVI